MPSIPGPVITPGAMRAQPQPTLRTEHLVLRPWRRDDAPAVLRAYADPDVRHWHCRSMDDLDESRAWITGQIEAWPTEAGASWAVTDPDDVLLGRVSLRTVDLAEGHAEVGYWVLPEARGRGAAVESTVEITRWSFDELGLHRLWLRHSTRNIASCRVAEKVGYVAEGTSVSAGPHADGWHDMHNHGIVSVH
ncbi:RimJ/RimL family protein N-acetyltransferase [Herbihabitans rhizosphaerae]|uniref:RimJ/RimL family protein N-acetyltransferase n=1 Tax=Herbihabitans rhizosphaerae TaxID=1872711 RepID=A0A4Q7KB91_9PSEU|nr:GNAT family N-acetyltransferase [Herbihabitans rhizosphaerae]RZS29766.1 RimJ/RimL family protein N-acetyltransferase [Herbihabitans rhizosphaerae]